MAWKDMEKKRAGQKAWYEKNKEIINAKKRERYHLTKPPPKPEKPKKTDEEIRARQKAYYQKNREKILTQMRAWQAANSEYMKEQAKKWQQNNKERVIEYRKKYYEENSERLKQRSKEWVKKAFEENPDKIRAERRRRKKEAKAKDPERYNMMTSKWNRKTGKAVVSELRDCYIKQLLCKHPVVKRLSAKDIPQEMVEAKRLEIKIRRELNEKRN
jgi:hypothetical protein